MIEGPGRAGGSSLLGKFFRLNLIVGLALAGLFYLTWAMARPAYASPLAGDSPPLPRDCTGLNPGDPVPACCMAGYVFYASPTLTEPLAVEDAIVTLTTQAGEIFSTTTSPGLYNEETAYFYFNLEAAGVYSGQSVTLTASYLDKRGTLVYHQLVSDGQQADIVLPETLEWTPVTVIVDNLDEASNPNMPGLYITGPVELLSEANCDPGAEFWADAIHYGASTAGGVGPPTIFATYRPSLPVSGTYELFAYAPHGCVSGWPRYDIHFPDGQVTTTLVEQKTAGESQGNWISLGWFYFPAGTGSYVTVNNLTYRLQAEAIGFDALKWELRTPFQSLATITVDDLDQATELDDEGFFRNLWGDWGEATTECDNSLIAGPIYWNGHTYWSDTEKSVDRAQWRPNLPADGIYDIYAFTTVCFANSRAVNYRIKVDDTKVGENTIDQAPQGGVWMYLGSYDLPAGTSSLVYLDDGTGEATRKLVAFDAVRWVLRPQFRPVATIHSIRPLGEAIRGQDVLTFRGSGVDTDEEGAEIVAYKWSSDLKSGEVLATSNVFTVAAADLQAGMHTISLRVQDNEGLWSRPVTTHVEIRQPDLAESWHFMLYLAGDNDLSLRLGSALNKLGALTLQGGVTVTVLFDRQGGGGVERHMFGHNGNEHWSLLEKNTGQPETLAEYILWAQANYPADHYYLAIADHGRGIQGLAWDDTSGADYLSLPELRLALEQGTQSGLLKIDVLHLDACLMGMAEVAYEVRFYARYLVASENLAWGVFAYDNYVGMLSSEMFPLDLAIDVAQIYHERVSDDPHTISVLDLEKMDALAEAVSDLADALIAALPEEKALLTQVLSQVQRLDSQDYEIIDQRDEFVDLIHLAELLMATTEDDQVRITAQYVAATTRLSQVYEQHLSGDHGSFWWNLDNANGLAIYFPPSVNSWDYDDYLSGTLQWGSNTQWDELLDDYLRSDVLPPPGGPDDPGLPPVLDWRVYLPLIIQNQ